MPAKKQPQTNVANVVRAAIYLRVSTEDQAAEGYGLEVQRVRCLAQIEAKGWQFAGEYLDRGISGTKGEADRPALARLMRDSAAGKFEAVVVLALDRLARKTVLVLNLVERLNAAGVALVSSKESLDTTTAAGAFTLTVFAALAQLERDTIVERTTAGRNERAKIDGERGGRLPLGYYRAGDGSIQVDSLRAAQVRRIFNLRERGATLRDIASTLNADGITTARNHRWHASSVREVLMNKDKYCGSLRGGTVRWHAIL